MPAEPARIGFIREEYRRVVASTPAITSRYGNLARESEDPIETFFDDVADAQVVADERQALHGQERRRFRCETATIEEITALSYVGAIPIGRYRDSERLADSKVLIGEILLDFHKQHAATMVWG